MSPKKTENPALKKTEKENLRLGRPITRAFLKANHGIIEELKRSLKNEPVSDCHGASIYYQMRNPTLKEMREERIPLEFSTQPEYQKIELRCHKCHKPTKPIQPAGEEGKK